MRGEMMKMEILFPGGKRVDSTYNGFTVKTDQSKENGGENIAPSPFDLFLASIGTCAGIYVLSFCQTRKIVTDGLKMFLRFDRDEKSKMIEKMVIEILLPDGFPEKYRSAVIQAAELCAVKKHLERPPQFEIITEQAR
jgi:putative redox protein